jgi:hypothetical protein
LRANADSLLETQSAAGTSGKMIQSAPSIASIPRARFGPFAFGRGQPATKAVSGRVGNAPAVVLVLVLCVFALLHCSLPLRTAVKIGADEEFELAKATLCLHGYQLYAESGTTNRRWTHFSLHKLLNTSHLPFSARAC